MSFELFLAFKYLIPRRRALSLTLISLLSVGVIALVVWLSIVFLSVTSGMERRWVEELVTFNAPAKIVPTDAYYQSYYYQIDGFAAASGHTFKTIGEKLQTAQTDPYALSKDPPLPGNFPMPDRAGDGVMRDLVKETWSAIEHLPAQYGVVPKETQGAFVVLKLQVRRNGSWRQLTQASYALPLEETPLQKRLLPADTQVALPQGVTPLYLSKVMEEEGVQVGTQGHLLHHTSSSAEGTLPVVVAGFFDPGTLGIGNRLLLMAPEEVKGLLSEEGSAGDSILSNSIALWFPKLADRQAIQQRLQEELHHRGLSPYWRVETYEEYSFARPLMEQLRSDRHMLFVVASILLLVASSNVVSMLILLVHDKRKEIAILQAMGASRTSIACIFGVVGISIGVVSAALGLVLALLTLHHLQFFIDLLGRLQGHPLFHSAFYGEYLPNLLSSSSLLFVLSATVGVALVAGLFPAIKASALKPVQVLKEE